MLIDVLRGLDSGGKGEGGSAPCSAWDSDHAQPSFTEEGIKTSFQGTVQPAGGLMGGVKWMPRCFAQCRAIGLPTELCYPLRRDLSKWLAEGACVSGDGTAAGLGAAPERDGLGEPLPRGLLR